MNHSVFYSSHFTLILTSHSLHNVLYQVEHTLHMVFSDLEATTSTLSILPSHILQSTILCKNTPITTHPYAGSKYTVNELMQKNALQQHLHY